MLERTRSPSMLMGTGKLRTENCCAAARPAKNARHTAATIHERRPGHTIHCPFVENKTMVPNVLPLQSRRTTVEQLSFKHQSSWTTRYIKLEDRTEDETSQRYDSFEARVAVRLVKAGANPET